MQKKSSEQTAQGEKYQSDPVESICKTFCTGRLLLVNNTQASSINLEFLIAFPLIWLTNLQTLVAQSVLVDPDEVNLTQWRYHTFN